jgi:hypothetical protein
MKIINNFPKITKIDAINNEVITKAPIDHASGDKSYGTGSDAKYGHVKVSDNYTSSEGTASEGIAASSKAVVDAYTDLHNYITNDFIKIAHFVIPLSSLSWITSDKGKYYAKYDITSLNAKIILSTDIMTWSGMRTTDVISVGCPTNAQLEITSNVNTFAHNASNINAKIAYI